MLVSLREGRIVGSGMPEAMEDLLAVNSSVALVGGFAGLDAEAIVHLGIL